MTLSENAGLPDTSRRGGMPAGNLATGTLKVIALVFMFIDHSGKVLFNNMEEMRVLGRIAFPIYVWCMIVGFQRTRSVPKYLLRLAIVGVISQPLYQLALDFQGQPGVLLQQTFAPLANRDTFMIFLGSVRKVSHTIFLARPNIFLSLILGLSALWGIREKKAWSQIWAPALAIALATVMNADYGWKGVTLFILLYAVRDSRPGIAAVMIAFFLFWGTSYPQMKELFGISLNVDSLPACLSLPLKALLRKETFALLSLPFILIRFRKDIRMPRWIGYALYPGHLVLLILLKILTFGWK